MKKLINKKNIIITLIALIALTACNLDSSRGVFQKKFADSAKNYKNIQNVLGIDSENNLIFLSDGGNIYRADMSANTHERVVNANRFNLADARIAPIFAKDDYIFFSALNDTADNDYYTVFYATVDDLNGETKINSEFIQTHSVPITFGFETENEQIVRWDTPDNFDLSGTYVTFSLAGENDGKTPDERTKHYGFIDRETAGIEGITISGGAEIHEAGRIIGDGVARVYTDGSDKGYSNFNHFYFISDDGTTVEKRIELGKGDYDNLAMGSDREYFITLEGDLYSIETGKMEDNDFVSDNLYRQDDLMPVFVNPDTNLKVGYLYESGIYINPDGADTKPDVLNISEDNDLYASAWLGSNGDDYLMASKESGFWIVTVKLNENGRYTGSIHQYDPKTDTPFTDFIK